MGTTLGTTLCLAGQWQPGSLLGSLECSFSFHEGGDLGDPSSELTEHLSKGTTLFQKWRCTHQPEEN